MNTRDSITAAWRSLERAKTRRDQDSAWRHLIELRTRERDRFAASRGWIACPWFTTGQLITGRRSPDVEDTEEAIDHRSCFALAGGSARRPKRIAIVSHVYGDPKRCFDFADRYTLAIEILDFSWYMPKACTAVLLTRPE